MEKNKVEKKKLRWKKVFHHRMPDGKKIPIWEIDEPRGPKIEKL